MREKKLFTTSDGREVTILIDDSGEEVLVIDGNGDEIGAIKLSLIDLEHTERYRITWMYLNQQDGSYLRQGIGRECLKFHKELFNTSIEASDDDGIVKDDGSHLTGDAPGFISQMRQEGLVRRSSFDFE
ncbi:hypothetical protein [Lysobacter terrae]